MFIATDINKKSNHFDAAAKYLAVNFLSISLCYCQFLCVIGLEEKWEESSVKIQIFRVGNGSLIRNRGSSLIPVAPFTIMVLL